ncbi:hypothetical protein ACWEKT_29185 [Nocardia takedensis]
MGVRRGRGRAANATLGVFCALLLSLFSLIGCDDRHAAQSAPEPVTTSSMCPGGLADVHHDDGVPHAAHFIALPGPTRSEHDDLPRGVDLPVAWSSDLYARTPARAPRCHGPPAAAEPTGRDILARYCVWRR